MIAWMCDRCEKIIKKTTRKNQRPDGWNTVRRNDVSYLLCIECDDSFREWLVK